MMGKMKEKRRYNEPKKMRISTINHFKYFNSLGHLTVDKKVGPVR